MTNQNLSAQDIATAMMNPKPKKQKQQTIKNVSKIAIPKANLQYSSIEDFINSDGVNYINISSYSKSSLGQKLDIFHHSPFTIPLEDKVETYNCLAGFWYYLTTLNEEFKTLSGKACLLKSKSEEKINALPNNFKELFGIALFYRIIVDTELVNELINNSLPLKYYFVKRDKKTKKIISKHNVSYSDWYIKAINYIKNVIKNKCLDYINIDAKNDKLAEECKGLMSDEMVLKQLTNFFKTI